MNELETISVGSLPAPEGVHEPGPNLHGAFGIYLLIEAEVSLL